MFEHYLRTYLSSLHKLWNDKNASYTHDNFNECRIKRDVKIQIRDTQWSLPNMTKSSIYYLYQYQTLLGCTKAELVHFMASFKPQWMSDKSKADFKHTNAKGSVSTCFLDVSYEAKLFLSQYAKIFEYRILISYL